MIRRAAVLLRRRPAVTALLFLFLLPFSAPARAPAAIEPALDQAALRRHIDYLASDALEGRAPGTQGGMLAAHYIATEFARAGLLPGAPGGGWYQPVALVERMPLAALARWRVGGVPVSLDPTQMRFLPEGATATLVRSPVIFAGFGTDPGSLDYAGKTVLVLSDRPDGAAPFEERRRGFVERGAQAVLALVGVDDPWELIRDQLGEARTGPAEQRHAPVEGALAAPAWRRLVPAGLLATAATPGFKPQPLAVTLDLDATAAVRRYDSVNVMGRLPGATRGDEAVLYLAHWDHLGLCRPPGAIDRICNGAVDNASGVATLIEVARRFVRGQRMPRSLYFIATTGEENGLLGARALARVPPVPLARIAAAVNFDTVAIMGAGAPIATIGRGQTPLDPLIDEAAARQGRAVDTSEAANAFLARQDGYALLEAGVPAIMAGGAFSDIQRLAAFLGGDYHKPGDDPDHPIPLDGAAEDGAFHVVLGRMLADPDKNPIAR